MENKSRSCESPRWWCHDNVGFHTLTWCAHIFFCTARAQSHFAHFSCVVTYTHGSRVPKRFFAHVSFLSISPSPVSCLTRLCFSCTVTSSPPSRPHRSCRTSLSWKRRECATPHEDEKFGYLAKSAFITGYEPKEFGKITPVDNDTILIDDPDLNWNLWLLETNHTEKIGLFDVLTMFESSVSHVSHHDLALQLRKQRNHALGKPLPEREREGFVISAAESMSKEGQRNCISVSLKSHRKILYWWMSSPRTSSTKNSTSDY